MNAQTIFTLVKKDWYLHRTAALLTLAGSIFGVVLLTLPLSSAPNIGASLTVGVLIALTFHLPLTSVLEERGQKTLTFLMSLPISPQEYVASKILANLSLFLLPWATIALGVSVAAKRDGLESLQTGFVPVVLLAMVLGFAVIISFALITESGGWTIALIVSLLFFMSNILTHLIPRTPRVIEIIESIANRGAAYLVALALEILLIGLILSAAFVVHSRKPDFL